MIHESKHCIFCGAELPKKQKPEHIVASSLGGRKSSRGLICSGTNGCNEFFGNNLDNVLASDFAWIRNLLFIQDADGNAPPVIRDINTENGKIHLLPGGGNSGWGKLISLMDLTNANSLKNTLPKR